MLTYPVLTHHSYGRLGNKVFELHGVMRDVMNRIIVKKTKTTGTVAKLIQGWRQNIHTQAEACEPSVSP